MNVQTPARAAGAAPVLLRDRDNGVALLTLNRPEARNSLSESLLGELSTAFAEIAADRSIRAVLLAGNGPTFCAGHDLKELTARRSDADRGHRFFRQIFAACSAMMQQIVNLPQPVVAAVQGAASAAGCQLVASCDLAVASSAAKFATPGVNIGLFCSTPMVALSRNVARKYAMEMLLTGEMISAEDAVRIGLINRAVKPGEERDHALALARLIASKASSVLAIGKQAFYRQAEMTLADAYRYTSEVMSDNMMLRDAEEGICAFIDKRDPKWNDR